MKSFLDTDSLVILFEVDNLFTKKIARKKDKVESGNLMKKPETYDETKIKVPCNFKIETSVSHDLENIIVLEAGA